MQGRISLSPEEIKLLEGIATTSGNDWFQIKTPVFIWDNDNKVRLSVAAACRELLECSMETVEKVKDKITLRGLYEKISYFPDFDFDSVNHPVG